MQAVLCCARPASPPLPRSTQLSHVTSPAPPRPAQPPGTLFKGLLERNGRKSSRLDRQDQEQDPPRINAIASVTRQGAQCVIKIKLYRPWKLRLHFLQQLCVSVAGAGGRCWSPGTLCPMITLLPPATKPRHHLHYPGHPTLIEEGHREHWSQIPTFSIFLITSIELSSLLSSVSVGHFSDEIVVIRCRRQWGFKLDILV